jgi:hypothetical protein
VQYKLRTPKNWSEWAITGSASEALRIYGYVVQDSDDETFLKDYLADKINKEGGFIYQSGDLASRTPGEVEDSDTCHVRIIEGTNKGREGWVHCSLMEMTDEWKEHFAKQEANKHSAAKKASDEKRRVADEAKRKQQAYIDSLPKLVSPGQDVMVATSLDCAKDLQNVVNFGRKNGTGVEFRKKMLELMALGCTITLPLGTPMESAIKSGQFVTFQAYKLRKTGVALAENVRWP